MKQKLCKSNFTQGYWQNGCRHGNGSYTWADGTMYSQLPLKMYFFFRRYEGDWYKDEATGKVLLLFNIFLLFINVIAPVSSILCCLKCKIIY